MGGGDEGLREMEVEEKKEMCCDQIPYFCYQKKNRGPLLKVRRAVVGSESGAVLCFLMLLHCLYSTLLPQASKPV